MFHIGHLNILKRAKEMSDYLIVGVSIDDLVRKYKGKEPVIPFSDRIVIVEALRYVDKVVPQIIVDKFKAWEELKYNALFQGDDWQGTPRYVKYEEQLRAVDVDLVFFPYTVGISSTCLCRRISSEGG